MEKIPKRIIAICRKLKIKVTRKTKSGKRVYKKIKVLKKEIKNKKKKLKKKVRKNTFGVIDQERFDRYDSLDWNVPKSEYSKNSWKRVKRNCEDGLSSILYEPIIPGMYVNLGHKKCLGIREIIYMSQNNMFLRN